jgi:hypothetical protein
MFPGRRLCQALASCAAGADALALRGAGKRELMRYYDLKIGDPIPGQVWQPTAKGNGFLKQSGGTTPGRCTFVGDCVHAARRGR